MKAPEAAPLSGGVTPAGRPAAERRVAEMQSARLLFQPMWAQATAGFCINRCILEPWQEEKAGAAANLPDLWQARARHDLEALSKGLEAVHFGYKTRKATKFLLPVHYETLEFEKTRRDYLDRAGAAPTLYLDQIVIEVHDIPETASLYQLAQVADYAGKASRRVVFRLPPDDTRAGWPLGDMIWGVSQDLSQFDCNSAAVQSELCQHAMIAAKIGWRTLAMGVNSLEAARTAQQAGFDYVAGPVIAPTAASPQVSVFPDLPETPGAFDSGPEVHVRPGRPLVRERRPKSGFMHGTDLRQRVADIRNRYKLH